MTTNPMPHSRKQEPSPAACKKVPSTNNNRYESLQSKLKNKVFLKALIQPVETPTLWQPDQPRQ